MKEIITAPNAPAAIGPYSHAVRTGNLLFTSGQIPLVPETGKLIEGGIAAQTEQVFRNLSAVLAAAGLGFSNVVKATVFVTDLCDFAAVNAIYETFFPAQPPARVCIQAAALPAGSKVEIELIASYDG